MAKSKDLIVGTLAVVGGAKLAKDAAEYSTSQVVNNITRTLGQPVVSLANIGSGNVDVTLPVYLLNSNPFSITIDKFFGAVSYGTVPLGNVSIPDQFTLVSGDNIALDLIFSVNISNTVTGVFQAIQTGGFSSILEKLYLNGSLYILGGSFFGQVEIPIETAIPIV